MTTPATQHADEFTLRRSDVARILAVSGTRVDQMVAEGKLSVRETPLGRLFHGPSVDALAAEREARLHPDQQLSGDAAKPETSAGSVIVTERGGE